MSFSRNWIGTVISQGERFVVQYLDRTFGGRIRQILEVTSDGVSVDGTVTASDVSVDDTVTASDLVVPGFEVQRTYVSDEIDFTTTPTGIVLFPATPGFYLRPGITFWYPTAKAGSLSTSPTFNAGSDGPRTNWLGSQTPSAATAFSAFSAGVQSQSVNCTIATPAPAVDSAILLNVTVAATGTGLTLRGRFITFGYLCPQ